MVGPISGGAYAQYGLQNTFRPGEQTGQSRQEQLTSPPSAGSNTSQNVGQTSAQQPVQNTQATSENQTRVSTAPQSLESPLTGTSADRGQSLDISV